jgi:hypothetical protein
MKMFSLTAVTFLLCSRCPAQISSAELSGTVVDSTGAAVLNATVTAINVDTTIVHKTVSEKGGDYVLTDLPPGN